jgi:hypothetical protein
MAYFMDLVNQHILNIIKSDSRVKSIVQTIRMFEFEQLMMTGGSLRNAVWNYLHNYKEDYELEDCDIIFYNSSNNSKFYEEYIKSELKHLNSNINWSVKNQARMHVRNGHKPYKGIYEALSTFPETCSAIAVDGNWNVVSPYGLTDLLNLTVAPTQFCIDNEIEIYYKRLSKKEWLGKWIGLKTHRRYCR